MPETPLGKRVIRRALVPERHRSMECQNIDSSTRSECYEPLERFIGISHKHWNNGKIMGDKSAIIPLDIRNGVILTKNGVSYRTPTSLTHSLTLFTTDPQPQHLS